MGDENDRSIENELEYEEEKKKQEVVEIDEEDEDEDELDEIDELEEMTSPRLSWWIDEDGKRHQEILVIINDISNKFKNKLKMIEPCSICYLPFSTRKNHRICCLPCGHLYGFSCIKKWLQTSSCGKCPLCNTSCTYSDAIPLHARSCASVHQKTSSTRHFPFTKQGLVEFKEHERLRFVDAKKMYAEDCDRLIEVLEHQCEVHNRRLELGTLLKDLSKRDEELEQDYALRRQALRRRYDALRRRFDALGRRADVLEQRIDVLNRWLSAYKPNMKYLIQMYKEHFALQMNTEPCVGAAAAAAPTCHKH